jgi:hypothetical protein
MVRTAGKTAFVFAGGGSLGAVQVGTLHVLLSSRGQIEWPIHSDGGPQQSCILTAT